MNTKSIYIVELTNTVHRDDDLRAHDLVPAVYAPYQPSRAVEGAGAAEWVLEGGVGGEVAFYGGALG